MLISLTQYQRIGSVRKHAKAPSQDDQPGVLARRLDGVEAEFMVEPCEWAGDGCHAHSEYLLKEDEYLLLFWLFRPIELLAFVGAEKM